MSEQEKHARKARETTKHGRERMRAGPFDNPENSGFRFDRRGLPTEASLRQQPVGLATRAEISCEAILEKCDGPLKRAARTALRAAKIEPTGKERAKSSILSSQASPLCAAEPSSPAAAGFGNGHFAPQENLGA
jgi:hypothetical protein